MQTTAEIYEEALKQAYGGNIDDKRENFLNEESENIEFDLSLSDEDGEEKNKNIEETELDFPKFVLSMAKSTVINWLVEIFNKSL